MANDQWPMINFHGKWIGTAVQLEEMIKFNDRYSPINYDPERVKLSIAQGFNPGCKKDHRAKRWPEIIVWKRNVDASAMERVQ